MCSGGGGGDSNPKSPWVRHSWRLRDITVACNGLRTVHAGKGLGTPSNSSLDTAEVKDGAGQIEPQGRLQDKNNSKSNAVMGWFIQEFIVCMDV